MSESAKALDSDTKKRQFAENPEMREVCRRSANLGRSHSAFVELSGKLKNQMFKEQPEWRKAVSAFMKEYLSHPENRAFLEAGGKAKLVMCMKTGECYPSQCATERASEFRNVHKACADRVATCGWVHWRFLTEEEKRRCSFA